MIKKAPDRELLQSASYDARHHAAIVCQIGAREHYALARALHRRGELVELITDIWLTKGASVGMLPLAGTRRLQGRYHDELFTAKVTGFTASALARAGVGVLSRSRSRWDNIIAANNWFQRKAAQRVAQVLGAWTQPKKPLVVAYSYAALEILKTAKRYGAETVLCQIDGGEADALLIEAIATNKSGPLLDHPPPSYWSRWHEECSIVDRIIVNSEWSRNLLATANVPIDKVVVASLIYEPKSEALNQTRLPITPIFNHERPLRALFLGALTMRKGIDEVLGAARALAEEPIEFLLVGADREGRGEGAWAGANIKRHAHVPRNEVAKFYREADVFLFPTHSDGFGLTQIEAMSEGLPVIASKNCATLVEHRKSGLVLASVTAEALVEALRYCVEDTERLAKMSAAAQREAVKFGNYSASSAINALFETTLSIGNT